MEYNVFTNFLNKRKFIMGYDKNNFNVVGLSFDYNVLKNIHKDNLHFYCVYEKNFRRTVLTDANAQYYRLIEKKKTKGEIILEEIYSSEYLHFLKGLFENDGYKSFIRENTPDSFIFVQAVVYENKACFMGTIIDDVCEFIKNSSKGFSYNENILIKNENKSYIIEQEALDKLYMQNLFFKIKPVFLNGEIKLAIDSFDCGNGKYAFCEIRKNSEGIIYITEMNNLFAEYLKCGLIEIEDICDGDDPFESYRLKRKVRNKVKGSLVIRYSAQLDGNEPCGFFVFICENPVAVNFKKISIRENHALYLAATGNPNKYIAHVMGISVGTVKKILHDGYNKLGISSRVELVRLYESHKKENGDNTLFDLRK